MLTPAAYAVAERLIEQADQVDDAMQIPAEEAIALHQLLVSGAARSVLEIGVSYGFSTLYHAHAMRLTGGHVHAVEADDRKFEHASSNLSEAGLNAFVTLHLGRAQQVLPELARQGGFAPFDFLFIDATKAETFEFLEAAWPLLAARCAIATDNSTTHAAELAPFIEFLEKHPEIISVGNVAIGNGFNLAIRDAARADRSA